MTTRAIMRCDFCGRETEHADAWGKLVVGPYSGESATVIGSSRDICGACIAQVSGWKGAA